ncbi:MAG TPA: hypothetical protein VIT44_15610 [Cyclobacteriaceae bacterium]
MKSEKVVFVLFLLAIACSKDDDAIPSAFSDYVNRFVAEGKVRGQSIDVSALSVNFVEETELAGYCGYGTVDPPRVQIRQTDNCWMTRSDMDKEILLFHELGHAILRRQHTNDTLPNGDYKSMMIGSNQFNIYNSHTPEKIAFYLDELFNPFTTTAPAWSNAKTQRVEIMRDSIAASNSWFFDNTREPEDKGTVNAAFSSSKGHALSISSASTSTTGFSSWAYRITPSDIPVGSRLVLKLKVKLNEVTGNGVYVALRGDVQSENVFFVTTEGNQKISGTQEFKEYSIKLNYYPQDVSAIWIFLIMDTSTGTAYFDDIELVNYR